MTSLLNQSGLNFQNGNPLGRKVRALESQVETLQKEVLALKNGTSTATVSAAGVAAAAAAPSVAVSSLSPSLLADLEMLKRDVAAIRMAGYGKGERGDRGDRGEKGEKGDKGDAGPMTYIAMPAGAPLPTPTTAAVPLPIAASVLSS